MERLTQRKEMKLRKCFLLAVCVGLIVVNGCSQKPPTAASPSKSDSAVDGSKYLLNSEPGGAKGVIKVREEAKDQDDVVIVGRIGGSENPWVEGRAAFLIVDPSLKSCKECGSDDCPKPWDYC